MQNFIIPGLYENHKMNILFLDFFHNNPQYFYDNINIRAIYGNFPFCTWDGGRAYINQGNHATLEQIQLLQKIYNNDFNLPMRFIFTNKLIEENDCYDHFNNLVLQTCQNDMNEIVINSTILEQYIRENYPQYKIISSTTKCITNREEAKKEILNPNYIMTCLDYNLNKDYKFLESLSVEEKAKTELLVNAVCGPGCPHRADHYTLNSQYSLNYGKPFAMRGCYITYNNLYPFKNNVIITPEELKDYYEPNDFSYFKLEGRSFSAISHLCNLVKYMVKPEYHLYVIVQLTDAYNKSKDIL